MRLVCIFCYALFGCVAPIAASDAPVVYDVIPGGDDGLTQRAIIGLEDWLSKSSQFRAGPRNPGGVLITIPNVQRVSTNVVRMRALIQVVRSDGQLTSEKAVRTTCAESELNVCYRQIADSAYVLAKRRRD